MRQDTDDTPVSEMTIDELIAIGTRHREQNLASGVSREVADHLTLNWIVALEQHQGLSAEKARALWFGLGLR